MPECEAPKRKSISKRLRTEVYNKYGGRCAYCGCRIEYKDMQVDHMIPKRGEETRGIDTDTADNYMPSCRLCNHYKRGNSLEGWRKMIEEIPAKLERDSYIYRVGVKYGLVKPEKKPVTFYYEEIGYGDEE